jgi:hypothetical protein
VQNEFVIGQVVLKALIRRLAVAMANKTIQIYILAVRSIASIYCLHRFGINHVMML